MISTAHGCPTQNLLVRVRAGLPRAGWCSGGGIAARSRLCSRKIVLHHPVVEGWRKPLLHGRGWLRLPPAGRRSLWSNHVKYDWHKIETNQNSICKGGALELYYVLVMYVRNWFDCFVASKIYYFEIWALFLSEQTELTQDIAIREKCYIAETQFISYQGSWEPDWFECPWRAVEIHITNGLTSDCKVKDSSQQIFKLLKKNTLKNIKLLNQNPTLQTSNKICITAWMTGVHCTPWQLALQIVHNNKWETGTAPNKRGGKTVRVFSQRNSIDAMEGFEHHPLYRLFQSEMQC